MGETRVPKLNPVFYTQSNLCLDDKHDSCPGSFVVTRNDSREERCECLCHLEVSNG